MRQQILTKRAYGFYYEEVEAEVQSLRIKEAT